MKCWAYIAIVALMAIACNDDFGVDEHKVSVVVHYPESVMSGKIEDVKIEFTNLSSGEVVTFSTLDEVSLIDGIYNVFYSARAIVGDGQGDYIYIVQALGQSVEYVGGKQIDLDAYFYNDSHGLVIQEIYYTGSRYPTGGSYIGDGYVKIFNNADSVIYVDGVALLESKLTTIDSYQCIPDIMSTHVIVDAVYVIPGGGKEHPLQPGESLTICDIGIDHRSVNENSIDLSGADFEWYDKSSLASLQDVDSPVDNLDKWYCYTNTIWLLHRSGYKTYAIARMGCDKTTYLRDYKHDYDYFKVTSAGSFSMSASEYKVPNEWLLDVVNLCVPTRFEGSVVSPTLDRGFAYCGIGEDDKNKYFKSVRRKMLFEAEDGRMVLQDTNNSSDDFNNNVVPSIIEEQGSAISIDGVKSTSHTYDGVKPRKEER